MAPRLNRREFVTSAAIGLAAAAPASALGQAPAVRASRRVAPVVIASGNGHRYTNGGTETCVETAFRMMTSGTDVLDALIAGVNIVELDPEDASVGYGGRPNADGVVQLDACCMHGPKRRAGGVAALEGVRTPSNVAQKVADLTDHHLLVGAGAQRFARQMGFAVEDDLNTDRSRRMWLDWKRRTDPGHYLDPDRSVNPEAAARTRDVDHEMLADGVLAEEELYGTINCDGINASGENLRRDDDERAGLEDSRPGRRFTDPRRRTVRRQRGRRRRFHRARRSKSVQLGVVPHRRAHAGGHASEGRRDGGAPPRAGRHGRVPVAEQTAGLPAFGLSFYVLDRQGRYAGVSMYAGANSRYAVCTSNGAELLPLEPLLDGSPRD